LLPEFASIALTLYNNEILTHRSDEQNYYIFVDSVAKPKNMIIFAFTYVLESFALLYGDFCLDLYSVDSDEALSASSLLLLRRVERFIATILFSALNASSTLLLKENHHLTLNRRYFFKEIHRLTLHRRYFLK
jgi:hypothetical protein